LAALSAQERALVVASAVSALRFSAIGADTDREDGAGLAERAGTAGRAFLVPPPARMRDGLKSRAELA
jgi:hypothetical protein